MAVDIQKLFNEQLPSAIENKPDDAKAIGGTYQINITGDGGGEWFIDVSDSGPKVEAGNPGGAECTIEMSADDFQSLKEDPKQGMQLFFQGRLKVQGNQMLAMKLQKVFELVT